MTFAAAVLTLVALQRSSELLLARRNTRRLLAQGAFEIAPSHDPATNAVHGLWLLSLWVFGWAAPVRWGWLAIFCLLQGLRVWVIAMLGPRWTTRIIALPTSPLVQTGPYRWVKHPNYLVVAAEIAVLPLAVGLPWIALVFWLLNGAVLFIRVRAENPGLAEARHAGLR